MSKKQKWLLVGILALAFFFRFYQIASMPGGLFPDEAAEGLDAHLIQQGQLQPFYERGNGREALFYYMIAGVISVFGTGSWQLHATSSATGLLAVIFCFLLCQKLFSLGLDKKDTYAKAKAINLALLSTFFMAVSTWHTVLSRTAFRANLIPLFTALTFYFLLLTYEAKTKKRQLLFAFLTGAAFAGGFYSYIAYRLFAVILAVLILWPLLASFRNSPWYEAIKQYWFHFVLFIIGFVLIIAPITHYFYTHPGSFVGRSSQVSIFNKDINGGDILGTLYTTSKESLVAYFTNGDLNWRHNISGHAFLSPLVSPFFALGLVIVTIAAAIYMLMPKKRQPYWKYALLAGSFWGMLIPVVTTAEGIPHGLRSIGTIPWVFIISALGLYWVMEKVGMVVNFFWSKIEDWKRRLLTLAFKLKTVVYFASLILLAYFSYFIYAANSSENFYAFRSDLTVVSQYLNEHGDKSNTYLVVDKFSVQTPEFLTMLDPRHPENPKNNPYIQVDPEDSWKLPRLNDGDKIIFTQSSLFDTKKFKLYHPEASLRLEVRNKFGETVMAVYQIKN